MYLKSFVQINNNYKESFAKASDSPHEKCQQIDRIQKRTCPFEVASRQRIDCQKNDLLLFVMIHHHLLAKQNYVSR